MPKISRHKQERIAEERSLSVFKRDDMIQKARFNLTVQEQRAILYAISKIQPEDTYLTEYTFELKDFYKIIGWDKESYNELKAMLKGLTDKSWWAEIDNNGTESVLRWFTTARTNKRSGRVTIKFHEDMMPYLLQLVEQGAFYTSYNLKYVLPMSSKHSPRLYEILKSYQKNNQQWFFPIEQLKKLMYCESYTNYGNFKIRVLEPAVEEINKYTDIVVAYDEIRDGRGNKVVRIEFYMAGKTTLEQLAAEDAIQTELDGQLDLISALEDVQGSVKAQFTADRWRAKNNQ